MVAEADEVVINIPSHVRETRGFGVITQMCGLIQRGTL